MDISITNAAIAAVATVAAAVLPPLIATWVKRRRRSTVPVPEALRPWRWLSIVSTVLSLSALIFALASRRPTTNIPGVTLRLREPVVAKAGKAPPFGIKEEEGFCFLTAVSGNFNGGGEAAKVAVVNGVWTLEVKQGAPGLGVVATAQCIKYVQQ